MEPTRFDRLAKTLAAAGTRRGIARLLSVLPLGVTLTTLLGDGPEVMAKKKRQQSDDHGSSHRRHRRKAKHRHQTGNNKEHRKGKHKGKRKVKAKDKTCTKRTCTPGVCGTQSDGCSGTMQCGCGTNQLCDEGACRNCTVTCPGGSCNGNAILQPHLETPGTVYACPGRYLGNFTTLRDVTLIGAGDGNNPQVDTILDAGGVPGAGQVLTNFPGVTAELRQVHITGGRAVAAGGAGIFNAGAKLTMRACTVTDNSLTRSGLVDAPGGGIFNSVSSQLVMTDCTVSANTVTHSGSAAGDHGYGDGIYNDNAVELTRCRIVGNTAKSAGGGFYNTRGVPTLTDCEITDNELTAPEVAGVSASGIHVSGDTVTLVNSFVWANTPEPQCSAGVNGAGCNVSPP